MGGRKIVERGVPPLENLLSSVIGETRSAARCSGRKIGIPIGLWRGLAYAIVESGWGWVISPNPRFESRFPD